MKRKRPVAKPTTSAEDLMKACGMLAKEAGLSDERRVFFTAEEPEPGILTGWTAPLNDDLEIEIDAVIGEEDDRRIRINERVGNPLQSIWSVTVWPSPDDSDETVSPIVHIRDLPFADALRIASAIIQTHTFKKVRNGA